MKKVIFVLAFFLVFLNGNAQTGIGTSTPHASAKLDVTATNKGFLPPRVTLTSNTDATTIPSPAEGLLVYNLGSVGLQAGYYYWNGANWATIATGTTAGNAVVAFDMVKLYSEVYSAAVGKIAHVNGYSFTVPVSGRYLFDFSSTGYINQASFTFTFSVRQGTTVLASDFQTSANNNIHVEYSGKLEVNLQSGVTYNVYVNTTGSRDSGDYDRVYYKLVAGNLPVNQHMAQRNIQLNNNYLSNDGDNEGIRIDNSGKVGIGTTTPGTSLHIENGNIFGSDPSVTTSPSMYIYNNNNASTTAHSSLAIRTNGGGGGNPYLSFDVNGVRGVSMGIDNADGDKFKIQNNWNLNNIATPAITITSDNRIGIGTASPAASLHVASSVVQTVGAYGFLNSNGNVGAGGTTQNITYSIQADQRIRAPEYNAFSDNRIKKDIMRLNSDKQLAELNKLKVVNYSYIDQLLNGNKIKTGFIAQEVEEVNEQFINQAADFIPSVFALAQSVSINEDLLQLTTEKPHGFEKGDLVKLYAQGKKEFILRIEEVRNSQSFSVKGWSESLDNIFIYGKQVNDFRAIDFDQITALSVGAIQELSKQVEMLKLENESFQKRISNEVQKQQSEIEKRLLKLESKLNKK